jgi:hypothetical protein
VAALAGAKAVMAKNDGWTRGDDKAIKKDKGGGLARPPSMSGQFLLWGFDMGIEVNVLSFRR